MKPVAVVQHEKTQSAGYLSRYLQEIGIETRCFHPQQGDDLPRSAHDFSGVVLLGSERSVNDRLPWIDDEAHLVHDALMRDVPMLGHCFGAQMIAKAMGARVCRNAWANIGWQRLRATPHGRPLMGATDVTCFNWHYETFSIPRGAQRLLFGPHCLNKAFAMGKHLAFQCHFEVTEAIVHDWCRQSADELERADGPAVQSRVEILRELQRNLPAMQQVARRVYLSWAANLTRPPVAHLHGGW
jgi:GMP synthase (glutamine-hydrolysing)